MAAMVVLAAAAIAPASAGAVTARSADSFVNSIGVGVHLSYNGTPYHDQFATVDQRLQELGVRHVRDDLVRGRSDEYSALNTLAGQGIGSTLIMGAPANGIPALDELLGIAKTQLTGIDALEGPNEPYANTAEAKSKLIEYQRHLYEGVKGDATLAHIPVLGPSIIRGEQATLGDVSAYLDYGNIHSYPEGAGPENRVGKYIEEAPKNSGTKHLFATESGYTNATSWTPAGPGENKPVPEEASGIYMPRLFFEYWTRHIERTFAYELVDEHENAALNEREEHFGLLRNNLTPKPAFVALRNTLATLADPGAAFTPGSLQYTLSTGGATLHSALLQKRDGSFYLALWRLESVWNPDTREAVVAPVTPETITVPAGLGSYAVYEPDVSSSPVATGGATTAVTVGVGAPVTIVKLVPAAPVTPPSEPPPSEPPVEPPPSEPPAEPAVETPAEATSTPVTQMLALVPFSAPTAVPAAKAPRCLVPTLTGRRITVARRTARRAGCALGPVTRETATVAAPVPATVVAQRPRAGASLNAGSRIAVTLRH